MKQGSEEVKPDGTATDDHSRPAKPGASGRGGRGSGAVGEDEDFLHPGKGHRGRHRKSIPGRGMKPAGISKVNTEMESRRHLFQALLQRRMRKRAAVPIARARRAVRGMDIPDKGRDPSSNGGLKGRRTRAPTLGGMDLPGSGVHASGTSRRGRTRS